MKKALKIILFVVLTLIALFLIAGLFAPKDFHLEREVTIQAPREQVWQYVHTLEGMEKWSPWKDHDPAMKTSIEGTDGTIGAVFSWEGEEVGSGRQTIRAIQPMDRVEHDLHFIKPFEAKAVSFVTLSDGEAGSTKVKWGYDTRYAYPMNAMMLIMNIDKMMGREFESGLSKLKKLSEAR